MTMGMSKLPPKTCRMCILQQEPGSRPAPIPALPRDPASPHTPTLGTVPCLPVKVLSPRQLLHPPVQTTRPFQALSCPELA